MPKPYHRSEVPSTFQESRAVAKDLARSFNSLEAFEIIDPAVVAGSRAVATPTIAEAWLARLECLNPSRSLQSRACRYLIRKLTATSEMIDERLRQVNDFSLGLASSGEPKLFVGGEPSACQLSISHSRDWLGVAITHQPRIGIDVEASKPRGRFREMAEYLGWDGAFASFDEFQERWTLWEACVKLEASSIFSVSNRPFEALCQPPGDRQFFSCVPWLCVRSRLSATARFALVVELEFPRPLRLRHYRPEGMDFDIAQPAIRQHGSAISGRGET